jgi:hypothetical protein
MILLKFLSDHPFMAHFLITSSELSTACISFLILLGLGTLTWLVADEDLRRAHLSL